MFEKNAPFKNIMISIFKSNLQFWLSTLFIIEKLVLKEFFFESDLKKK